MADPRSFQMGRIKKSQGFETNWLTAFLQGHIFVSTQNGNWNDPATWGNAGVPSKLADTVTIAGHNITIPAGTTNLVGAVTLQDNSILNINGTLTIYGDMNVGNTCTLNGSAGGFFYLNGRAVKFNGTGNTMNFTGTAKGSTATTFNVRGGPTGRGYFFTAFPNVLTCNWNFVDCQGLAASVLGRSHVSTILQKVTNCYFYDMAEVKLDETGTNIDSGFQWNNNDVRSMSSTLGASGGDCGFPSVVYGNQALGINPREIKNNTYDVGFAGGLPAVLLLSNVKCAAANWFTGNVLGHVRMSQLNNTNEGFVADDNFWYLRFSDNYVGGNLISPPLADALMLIPNTLVKSFSNSYVYVENEEHFFSGLTNGSAWSFTNFVFENQGTSISGFSMPGANWFINAADNGTISNGILLGVDFGNLFVITKPANYVTGVTIKNITAYVDNRNQGTAFDRFPILYSQEQAAATLAGIMNVYNNIHYDIDLNATAQEFIVANETSNATTITRVSNNDAWPLAPKTQAANLVVTNTGGDLNVDPIFADKTRNLAKWDLSLGGPGTAEHAFQELCKKNGTGGVYNAAYTNAAAIAYVFAGFQPTGAGLAALNGTGFGAGNIGAR